MNREPARQATGEQPHATAASDLALACSLPFDRLPSQMIVRALGVDYGHVQPPEGGDLYVTRYGWPFLGHLLPANWYTERRYAMQGNKLPGSGHVYHVTTGQVDGRSIDIVVKFSRVGREVPLEVATTFPDDIPPEVIANARFNSPMEEFGLVMELRRGAGGSKHARVHTQWPLAIYAPAEEFELWQLGRDQSRFHAHWHLLAQDQENRPKAIELDIRRIYVLLYSWIKGEDAEEALKAGYLGDQDCTRLTVRAIEDLRSNGFRVLDNKPRHFIVRRRGRDDALLRRDGDRIVYGLVDFELLQRTPVYQSRFRAAQREKYWHLQARQVRGAVPEPLPSHVTRTSIFGVEYLFGTTADGGKLWAVGRDAELFDYFLPDRWRRTPRAKLSLVNEVYHTRTRDGIHVVYRRSQVGTQPRVDPLVSGSKRLREHGYNSPFEEVAMAERLRCAGIASVYPRAIYRTGHRSRRVAHLRDDRRFATHAQLTMGEAADEPMLSPEYDYYTIWGYFRGIDPQMISQRGGGITDLEQAQADGLLAPRVYTRIVEDVQRRLQATGFNVEEIAPYEFAVGLGADGMLQRGADGEVEVSLCIDAQTAYEYGLMDEERYRALIESVEARVSAAGYAVLNLVGHHVLLAMQPDGTLRCSAHHPTALICNFEFVR